MQIREALSANTTLEEIEVTNCVITSKRFRRFCQGLGSNGRESSLTEVHFDGCNLSDRCGEYLGNFLCSPPPEEPLCLNLAVLSLSDNKISDSGCFGIAHLLHPSGGLVRLHLGKNRIGNPGTISLAEMLPMNKTLHTLDLAHNVVGPAGGMALAGAISENKYLSSLELQSNRIGSQGALAFAKVLNSDVKNAIATLDVSCNNIGDAGGSALQQLADDKKSIGNLIIHGNCIGQCDCKLCLLSSMADSNHWSYGVGAPQGVFVEVSDHEGYY